MYPRNFLTEDTPYHDLFRYAKYYEDDIDPLRKERLGGKKTSDAQNEIFEIFMCPL